MKINKTTTNYLLFAISFIVYLVCLPKGITFWDSAEFIASNYKLQTTHPAGAPFYTLLCNVVTGIFFFLKPALVSNIVSAFFGALTIPLINNITLHFAEKIKSDIHSHILMVTGIVASLSFAFCHSFWTASTETEVYTLSFFLLTLVVWLALLWEKTESRYRETQLFLLIFLILGISVGVHLINIAVIIPLTLVYCNKKYRLTFINALLFLAIGLFLFIFLLNFLFQGILSVCASVDIWLVNTYHFSVNTGAFLVYTLFLLFLIVLAYLSHVKRKGLLTTIIITSFLFCLGTSSYLMPIIRSQVNTPTSTQTHTFNSLLSYIRAEQFGVHKIPLLMGSSFNAPLDNKKPFNDIKPTYSYNKKLNKYIVINDGKYEQENYDKKFSMVFPRVFHKNSINSNGYKTWTTIKGKPITTKVNDKTITINKPTFSENLSFFYNYQVSWLYLRYLFQNFVGTQNTLKGVGDITTGNWSSGFNFIDKNNISDSKNIPNYFKNLNSNDQYYFIPFLMGIWGLFLLRKNKAYFYTSFLLFLLFGLGIIVYVNPVPQSILIRERDYIFTASFIFFSIWIGLSVLGIYSLLNFIKKETTKIAITIVISLLLSPIQLVAKGFDNHYRKNEDFAHQLAKSYLDSCPNQAILITNTDNFTFPLWYLQEVENYRTDVRVINYDQLVFDWYLNKLKLKINNSKPLNIGVSDKFNSLKYDTEVPLKKITDKYLNIQKLSSFIDNPSNRISWFNKKIHFFPTEKLLLPISKSAIIEKEILNLNRKARKLDTIRWQYQKNTYIKNDIALINIIAHNFDNRPICFSEIGNSNHTLGLNDFLVQKGLIKQFIPVKVVERTNPKIINTELSFNTLVKNSSFLPQDDIKTKVTDESITISKVVLRRSYYFLAQALLEENNPKKALEVLDFATQNFPNSTIPYEEFAFSIGKLYYRLKNAEKGNSICKTSIKNIEDKIKWIISFDPPRPIINVRYATSLMNKYNEMVLQLKNVDFDLYQTKSKDISIFQKQFTNWQKRNWPY